jgi:ergothioneine biosynthesis protein EgtB
MEHALHRTDDLPAPADVLARFQRVRARTVALCAPLEVEDYVVQSMEDASPARWHLAHTTWFFETFVLAAFAPGHEGPDARWLHLFNSYYRGAGDPFPRPRRGTLSRPTVAEVLAWRHRVDELVPALFEAVPEPEVLRRTLLGTHHEEQHQELILTDIKHAIASNPLRPAYRADACHPVDPARRPPPAPGLELGPGFAEIGAVPETFCYDNELPRHRAWTEAFALDGELVRNEQWMGFISDGGYADHRLWLADGWDWCRREGVGAPLYWEERGGVWLTATLGGLRPVDPDAPVTHVSFFEADAFARWAGARLPSEAEWERAAVAAPSWGTTLEDEVFHPVGAIARAEGPDPALRHVFGEVWEWTASAYRPYPRYRAPDGTLGEYNGKFMNGQYVLRGGSCATPRGHLRPSYRNFFGPEKRWQFSGVRLAHDLHRGERE